MRRLSYLRTPVHHGMNYQDRAGFMRNLSYTPNLYAVFVIFRESNPSTSTGSAVAIIGRVVDRDFLKSWRPSSWEKASRPNISFTKNRQMIHLFKSEEATKEVGGSKQKHGLTASILNRSQGLPPAVFRK